MSTTIQTSCAFCEANLTILSHDVTMAECPACLNVNKVFDGLCLKFNEYNLKGKLRLAKAIKTSKIKLNNELIDIHGVLEIEYNEASIYLFFNYTNAPRIFSYFEYQWYEVSISNIPLAKLNPNHVKSGEYYNIFNDAQSYVINKEDEKEFAFCGQVRLPRYKEKITFLEHAQHSILYLSLFEKSEHLTTFQFSSIQSPIELTEDFIHYPATCICSRCNVKTTIDSFPFTKSYVCVCGASYSLDKNGEPNYEKKYNTYNPPNIELNTTCTLEGIPYRVIGHTEKEDTHGYSWNEFTLWHNQAGFRYLSVYKGHWILLSIEKLKYYIPTNRHGVQKYVYDEKQEYSLYNDYKSSVVKCSGIFAGNILNDGEYFGIEYIAPPSMWAFEKPENESVTVFKGRHIDQNELSIAFDHHIEFSSPIGVGAIQPVKGSVPIPMLTASFIIGFLILFFAQMISSFSNQDKVIYNTEQTILVDSTNKLVTLVFYLEKDRSNLSFILKASMHNSWLENEIELINVDNGQTINTEQGVEFYSGSDSDGSWSEGDLENEKIISYLEKGHYQVSIQSTFDKSQPPYGYVLTIKNDVVMYKNFLLLLLTLAIPCLFYGIYVVNNEEMRWRNSEYSPFNNEY